MEKLSEVFNKREVKEKAHRFTVYFLYDDEDQNVHVEEVEQIDFFKVIQHLDSGGEVFITHKRKPEISSRYDFQDLETSSRDFDFGFFPLLGF